MRVERIGTATLYQADCLEVLPTLAPVDAVVTDPPYNVGKKYGTHDDDMTPDEYVAWLTERWRALRTQTLVYTPGDRHFWDSRRICEGAGFTLGRMLAWHKKEFAGDKFTAGPAMCWEPVIWAYRGERAWNKLFGHDGRDHLTVPSTHGNDYADLHPCPKPIEVPRWLVRLFSKTSVADPFMGTGTTGEAAVKLGREFYGMEIDPEHFDTACRRIEAAMRGVGHHRGAKPASGGLFECEGSNTGGNRP